MSDTILVQTLTEQESSEFLRLDDIISTGAKTFMAVGLALVKMHKGRLYRQFGTFEAYCVSRGIKRQSAYRLMSAVQTTLELEQCPLADTPRDLVNIEVLKNSPAKAAETLGRAPEAKRLIILDAAVVASDGKPLTTAAIAKATAEVTHTAFPDAPVKKPITLHQFDSRLCDLEREVNEACAGNQAERRKFGVIANAMAGRLMNPPPTTSCYTR